MKRPKNPQNQIAALCKWLAVQNGQSQSAFAKRLGAHPSTLPSAYVVGARWFSVWDKIIGWLRSDYGIHLTLDDMDGLANAPEDGAPHPALGNVKRTVLVRLLAEQQPSQIEGRSHVNEHAPDGVGEAATG